MAYENVFDFLVFNSRFDDLESVSGSAAQVRARHGKSLEVQEGSMRNHVLSLDFPSCA